MENESNELEVVDSFIIKLWAEEVGEEGSQGTWQGVITHVPSGRRQYFGSLEEVNAFLIPYLEKMGVEV
jgi:hypothetical protein